MHISYQPLWDILKHISMKTLLRICGALHCDIADVIALEQDENSANKTK